MAFLHRKLRFFYNGTNLALLLSCIIFAKGSVDDKSFDVDLDQLTCRSRGVHLTTQNFQAETCALCYLYMPGNQFQSQWGRTWVQNVPAKDITTSSGFIPDPRIILLTNGNTTVVANHSDVDSPLLDSFINEGSAKLWRDCCQAAIDCCMKMRQKEVAKKMNEFHSSKSPESNNSNSFRVPEVRCPPTWDGWQCWEDGGTPGTVEYGGCPNYIYFHTGVNEGGQLMQNTCGRYAEKTCTASGNWFLRQQGSQSSSEWTDFTTCSRVSALLLQEHAHIGMYWVSAAALLPAIIIFFSYKTLCVPRISIHKNMFASLLLHGILMVTFKGVVLLPYIQTAPGQMSVLRENTSGCRLLLMLTKYFRLTNYTWMFCEGYYLHRLLANTFEEERSLAFILSIGWGIPMVPCFSYAILRLFYDDSLCWTLPVEDENGWIEWIYMAPGLICILANFIFFVNIFRILVTKLQAPHANEPAHFRKAVRATVVLLPLFGLHWLLTLYRPQSGHCFLTTLYKYVNVILDGLQGLMVAIAFCYRNGEIRNLLRTSWKRVRERYNPQGHTTNIQLSEFPRGGSDTCITQVPQQKIGNHGNHNHDDDNASRSLLAPSINPKVMKSVVVLEAQGPQSSGAPSPSTKSINSTGSNSNY